MRLSAFGSRDLELKGENVVDSTIRPDSVRVIAKISKHCHQIMRLVRGRFTLDMGNEEIKRAIT
jgi:hypothetical protein